MSETLKSIMAVGSGFITRSIGGGSIASSSGPGDLVTITPLSSQKVKLTHLSTEPGDVQTGISVEVGGVTVVNSQSLSGSTPTAGVNFSVGSYQPYPAGAPPASNHRSFIGNPGEELKIKSDGVTSFIIYYGYEFGE